MEYVKLNNGMVMPMAGYGTWDLRGKECVNCIAKAIDTGYRLIDTAIMYNNEKEVGEGIRASGIDREKLFVTNKINSPHASYEKTLKAVNNSLDVMKLEYLDLVLIHEPYAQYKEMYRALEDLYAEGRIRSIGISNINRRLYDALLKECRVIPAVNQVECHVYYPQLSYQRYLAEHGTVMESWAPFTEGRRKIFSEEILNDIAHKHGKSAAQIALRYLVQNGIVVIPKSAKENRMKENIDLFDFVLDEEDMKQIRTMDEKRSLFGW
jgi:diketogulonate reductase-like aldo/keto reductase